MKTLRALIIIPALLGLALNVSCGKKETVTDDGREIIRFWQFWTEPRVKAVVTNAIAEFEQQNPLYKVEVTDLTWDNGYQKIVAAFASDRVCRSWCTVADDRRVPADAGLHGRLAPGHL